MKTGIISSGELAIPALQFFRSQNIPVVVFAEVQDRYAFEPLQHFCSGMSIEITEGKKDASAIYSWMKKHELQIVWIIGYPYKIDISRVPATIGNRLFNIHFGALPAFRGPSPVFWQLKLGVPVLSLTIHRISNAFDAGPIVWEKTILRESHFTYGYVHLLFSQLLVEGILYLMQQLIVGASLREKRQSAEQKKYYQKPKLKDVSIDWERMSASEIIHLIQACNPWNKGVLCYFNKQPLKIIDAYIVSASQVSEGELPGTILKTDQQLYIACCDYGVIAVNMLYFNDSYIPAYHCNHWGLIPGKRLG